ncbi:MAG: nitroreductase family protein [Eubacteriales bacterium]|nr:nitroreductase family protein [Eubacteriales bacterium]
MNGKVYETIIARRTVRKFRQDRISADILERLVNAARLAPSAMNMQPLRYAVISTPSIAGRIFDCVKWARYIAPAGDPGPDEKPVAYIAILVDASVREKGYEEDVGAAAQNIMLAAWEEGIGSCWMGSIDREKIRNILNLEKGMILDTVIALGYKGEEPVYEEERGSIKYYKDETGLLHVPKKGLTDIMKTY